MIVTTNMAMMTSTENDEIHEHKKKKQRNNNGRYRSSNDCELGFEFAEDEIEVANTLLNLSYLISKTVSSCRFSNDWGSKRRRSTLDNPPPPRKEVVALPPPPPPPHPAAVTTVTSPDTPLALPTSESDWKSNHSIKKKTPVKRTREELQRMVDERIQTQQTLMEEIEKVKLHLENLMAENYELKSKKHKLMEVEVKGENQKTQSEENYELIENDNVPAAPSTSTEFHHYPPSIPHRQGFIINHTVHSEPDFREQFQCQQLGPLGFDLNVSAEEMVAMETPLQPSDHGLVTNMMISTAIELARVARRKRVQINRSKRPTRVR